MNKKRACDILRKITKRRKNLYRKLRIETFDEWYNFILDRFENIGDSDIKFTNTHFSVMLRRNDHFDSGVSVYVNGKTLLYLEYSNLTLEDMKILADKFNSIKGYRAVFNYENEYLTVDIDFIKK